MTPRGKLIVIGGAVDTGSFTEKNYKKDDSNLNFFEEGILKRILTESAKGKESRIEIIPTASQMPVEVGNEYVKAFSYLDAHNTGVLFISTRDEANDSAIIERLANADVVVFTGGDQLRLTSILGGTEFHHLLLKKYRETDFLLAGTSAGAAACSNNMIYQGSASEALLKGEVKITSGLGLINDVIIDTHFVQRGRIGRLFQAVVSNPMALGIGLGEDTGLLIKNGGEMIAVGSGLVILVDGRHVRDTNITDVPLGAPISISNLVVHVMSKGDYFDVVTRQLTIHKEPQLAEKE
ncbi:MAG: cyanophycinase [Sphingobacteriaceae bacterium]|nr:cyanophycinase [Sphingobacteriaceae bacterium]